MSLKNKYYEIVTNKADPTSVDILIFGVIGSSFFEESITAKQFRTDFAALDSKYDKIHIRINTPGGSVFDGNAIYNIIRNSKKETHTYNDGICYSMGLVILQAGKTRHTAKNGTGMGHNAAAGARGNAKDMRDAAEYLDKIDSSLITGIANRTGKTEDEIKKMIFDYQDHFYTAQELLDNGLVDVIDEYESDKVPSNIQNLSPSAILEYYEDHTTSWFQKFINSAQNLFENKSKNQLMNKAQALALLLAKDALTEDQRKQIADLLNDVSVVDHKKATDTLTAIRDALGDDAKKEGADLLTLVKNAISNFLTVKKIVEDIRVIMGGKADDTSDLLAICKEQKEKADKSTNHKTTTDGGEDQFDDDKKDSWEDAPWNVSVRAGYKKPEKK